jgi:hypothetical protein
MVNVSEKGRESGAFSLKINPCLTIVPRGFALAGVLPWCMFP